MIRPTLSEAKEYAKQGYHMVPVCYEMLSQPEPYPVHRRSGHVRSSTSLKITNEVFTAARSVISIFQEIWIPASRSESYTARGIKYLSVPVPAL